LAKCPPQTYQDEELIVNSETGEKGERRVCKPCTAEKCPKGIVNFSSKIVLMSIFI
jgi:hypothetical protein